MYLKSLTLNGFKSFAKKGELEFTTPITAIVGPNGSGKSNVAEAFRFVLGEQSIKSLRGKKGEDLIFNGSESVSRSNRASVLIALRNEEKGGKRVFPIDFDEITIERIVYRDGTNEYLLNGAKTRLKDIQEILAVANIGPSGHHIISQGEADRILSASPRERREMIEDALGLKVYQFKKAESERKLKKTRENIEQVQSLRREVTPHLKFLERQVKKIERSLELQNELKVYYADYLKREDVYLAFHHDRLLEERRVPEIKLKELQEALIIAKEHLAQSEKDEKRDALVLLERDISEVRARRQEGQRKMGQIEGQILFLTRRIDEAKRKSEHTTGSPIPFTELKRASEEIEKTAEHALKEGETKSLQRALADVVNVVRLLLRRAQNEVQKPETERDEEELNTLTKEKHTLERSADAVSKEEAHLEVRYRELKQSIEAEASKNREAERAVFALMNEMRTVEQMFDRASRELAHIERDRDEFKRELQEAVSLIGRGASMYFEHTVVGEDGKALSQDVLIREDRTIQIERRRNLEKMKIRLEELGMGTNDDILKEYKDVKERDEFLVREITDLTESVTKLESLIEELTRELNEQFVTGIDKIDKEFSRFFILMFGGGSASLIRTKPKVRKQDVPEELLGEGAEEVGEEEVEEGIEIDVKLPNKRVRGLDMLSGGERALTSIALIFAMSQVNPPLFVILDETDAALDEANSRRYGDMITALAERSQLILITHNRETMGRAGVLYGVTMAGDGVSKLLSVKFDEAVAVAK
jgi:chromosome segregation protein